MQSTAKPESKADKWWRFGFYALGAAFLVAFAVVSIIQNGAAFLLLIAAGLALLASRLPDITKFKLTAGGLETELREALAEAQATVSQLQFLAAENAKLSLFLIQADGRWGGGGSTLKAAMRENVMSSLEKLGLTAEMIRDVQAVEKPYLHFDHANWVTHNLRPTSENTAKWNEFFGQRSRQGIGHEHTPSELRAFLTEMNMLSEDIEGRLQDYEHYHRTDEIRRPEVWARHLDSE